MTGRLSFGEVALVQTLAYRQSSLRAGSRGGAAAGVCPGAAHEHRHGRQREAPAAHGAPKASAVAYAIPLRRRLWRPPPVLSEGRRGVRNTFEHTDGRLRGAGDAGEHARVEAHLVRNHGRWPRNDKQDAAE